MKAIFSVVGLLVVLAIVGVLAKRQLSAGVAPAASPTATGVPGVAAPTGTPQQQVQQFQKSVEGAMQPPPRAGDDAK